jgi:hypothetical protein
VWAFACSGSSTSFVDAGAGRKRCRRDVEDGLGGADDDRRGRGPVAVEWVDVSLLALSSSIQKRIIRRLDCSAPLSNTSHI